MSSRFQNVLPIILSICMVSIVIALAVRRLADATAAPLVVGAGAVVVYLLWLFVEAKVAVREIDADQTRVDKGTLEIYAAGRLLTVAAALFFDPLWVASAPLGVVGLILFVAGVLFRLTAIRTLGRFYSHRVRVASDHTILQDGLYRFLRHPAYTGMLAAHLGFVLVFFNPVAVGVFALIFVPGVILRLIIEERVMMEVPGYAAFARTRKRLIPGVF